MFRNLNNSRTIRVVLGKQTLIIGLIWAGWLTAITKIDFTPYTVGRCAPQGEAGMGILFERVDVSWDTAQTRRHASFLLAQPADNNSSRARPYSIPVSFFMLQISHDNFLRHYVSCLFHLTREYFLFPHEKIKNRMYFFLLLNFSSIDGLIKTHIYALIEICHSIF